MEPGQISVNWTWKLRRSGSVPAHARLWWQWHLTGEAGKVPVRMVMFTTLRGQDLVVVAVGVPVATFETEWRDFEAAIASVEFLE